MPEQRDPSYYERKIKAESQKEAPDLPRVKVPEEEKAEVPKKGVKKEEDAVPVSGDKKYMRDSGKIDSSRLDRIQSYIEEDQRKGRQIDIREGKDPLGEEDEEEDVTL